MQLDEPAGSAWQGIEVDLRTLQQLTDALSTEVQANLAPNTDDLFRQYVGGACFGTRSPSLDLHAVRSKYADCLGRTLERLSDYLTESSTLADVGKEILARYQNVDALAAASVNDVNQMFVNDQGGG
jgi:hypothetical protein